MKKNMIFLLTVIGLTTIGIASYFYKSSTSIKTKPPTQRIERSEKKRSEVKESSYIKTSLPESSMVTDIDAEVEKKEAILTKESIPIDKEAFPEEFVRGRTTIEGDVALDPTIAEEMERNVKQIHNEFLPPQPIYEIIEAEIKAIERSKQKEMDLMNKILKKRKIAEDGNTLNIED
jgi:hypothetical protein